MSKMTGLISAHQELGGSLPLALCLSVTVFHSCSLSLPLSLSPSLSLSLGKRKHLQTYFIQEERKYD